MTELHQYDRIHFFNQVEKRRKQKIAKAEKLRLQEEKEHAKRAAKNKLVPLNPTCKTWTQSFHMSCVVTIALLRSTISV